MNNFPNNNFSTPYGANYTPYGGYSKPQQNYFAWVNGYTGAQAYIVAPNTTTVLLDSERPFMYIKTADNYGRADLKAYKYEEYKEQTATPTTDFVTRKEFEELKKELTGVLKNERLYADNATNEQRQPTADSQSNVAE